MLPHIDGKSYPEAGFRITLERGTVTTIYTIGHSRHDLNHFLHLLGQHGIRTVADLRSRPYSKWAPHFQRNPLSGALDFEGIEYVFLGSELGGRPEGREFYDHRGRVDYARRAEAPDFVRGIEVLSNLGGRQPTAVMCAEEDPDRCHRRLLVTPALRRHGLEVIHVRGDGSLERDEDPESPAQRALF